MKTIILSNLLTATVVALAFTSAIAYGLLSGHIVTEKQDYLAALADVRR